MTLALTAVLLIAQGAAVPAGLVPLESDEGRAMLLEAQANRAFFGLAGDRIGNRNLICLMRPYETVTVRGLPVRRVARVTVLGTGTRLGFSTRTGVLEQLTTDPEGEVTITVPEREHDVYATVLALDLADEPIAGRSAIGEVKAGS